jgi:hypothetical protein
MADKTVEVVPVPAPSLDIQDRLRPFFEAVEDKTNWKNPIAHAYVSREALADTIEAIQFFAGSATTVAWDGDREMFRLNAPGYYISVGA